MCIYIHFLNKVGLGPQVHTKPYNPLVLKAFGSHLLETGRAVTKTWHSSGWLFGL